MISQRNKYRYSNSPIKKVAQDVADTATAVEPNFGDTTVVNKELLPSHLNALQNEAYKVDTKQKVNFNKMVKYIQDLIQKSKDPNAVVAMAAPTIDQIKTFIAYAPGSPGVDPDVIINILTNVRNNRITDNDIRILKDVKNKLI